MSKDERSSIASLRAEVERLRGEVKDAKYAATDEHLRHRETITALANSRAETERLQKVVADQALTIGTLKDTAARMERLVLKERDINCNWRQRVAKLEEEAQTSRLALDVARREAANLRGRLEASEKELECLYLDVTQEKTAAAWDTTKAKLRWFEERDEQIKRQADGRALGAQLLNGYLQDYARRNPKPGAAT